MDIVRRAEAAAAPAEASDDAEEAEAEDEAEEAVASSTVARAARISACRVRRRRGRPPRRHL